MNKKSYRKLNSNTHSNANTTTLPNTLLINKKIISSKIVYCDTFFKKGTGLMFRKKSSVKNTAWVFKFKKSKKIGVTMMFVFFPIDIVFLDEKNRVIELVQELKPFSHYNTENKIRSFIELESGTIGRYSIDLKDKIVFK